MEFKLATTSDVDEIMNIIKVSQEYFKEQGIDQWQNNYPNERVIEEDIKNKSSYVLKEDNQVLGTAMVSFSGEKNYDKIYDGDWVSNTDYAVIHRIAVHFNQRGTGLSSIFLEKIEELCKNEKIPSIKVDTHRANMPMQKLLLKNGYKYCGIIYLDSGDERLAYEKLLK